MEIQQRYQRNGVEFEYPEPWELTEEPRDGALTITVGDGGAFWSVTVLKQRPEVEAVLDQACAAFREEYDELDEYPAPCNIGGETVAGRQLEFVSQDLINLVQMAAVEAGGVTLFVMSQVTDHERDQFELLFQRISRSLHPAPDENILIG
ncbi:hypothetical protein [Planctomicrobium sp. SH664]|uniref:hypothetical protein n=1 Tax=Planctomicrobium sp. SH664 TaxID=3448125 RepID=UPI003F5CB4D5